MRKLLSFLLVLFAGITVVLAQPQKMTYQAVVRDANNELVVNQLVGIQVSIYEDYINGPLIYCETHTATTNGNALVTIEIGTGVHVYITSLADVQWGKHDHFLKVEIDPAGGTNYSITGTQQLVSVPYAFYAEAAKLVDTAKYAANALHADTAYYLANFQNSDTSKFAFNSDSSAFAYNANNANTAIYADTADYNKLLNKPTGTNMGDILYWDTITSSWHILPVGNIGEVLTLDSSYIPQWNTGGGASYNLPTVVTNPVNSYTGYDADVSGAVTNDGGTPFVVGGFCWSQNANPTINDNYSMDGIGVTSFNHKITGLNLGTTYHFRAFATNSAGTAYGADESFTTWNYPTVTTNSTVTTISATTAYCGGNVTSDGGNYVNQRGVVWSSWNNNPTVDDNDGMTSDGSGTGSFQSYLNGLQQGTTYYVCAYATNDVGTVYGSTVSFTTLRTPVVSTNNTTDIDTMSAVSGGNVSSDGGDPVTDYGIVWSTSSWVDINNYLGITSHGAGTPPFTFYDTMKNLTPGQYYYVRAYATNSIGTNYGNVETFSALPVKPTVTTDPISWYYEYDADCSGNVTADGGAWVSQRGFCWNTTGNPTIADSYTTDWNSGTGSYSLNIGGLNPGTKYYVRAFATNSAGTAYGNEVTFTTNATYPTVTTDVISDTAATFAVSGGNVTSDGGDSVTVRGIIWTDQYNYWDCPDFNNYYDGMIVSGSGTGAFTDTMQILTPGHYYYYRAYATNSIGTSYGSCYSFQASLAPPTVATSATVTSIKGDAATCGGEIISDGGDQNGIQYGICWDTVPIPVFGTNNFTSNSYYDWYGLPYQFSSSMSGLSGNTTYYVRAYAINSVDTAYGSVISFTTLPLPTVTTSPVTNVITTAADCGGDVLTDGGYVVSSRGVCYGTNPNPTIYNSKTVDGTGLGSFTSALINLQDSTTYYVRAYATSGAGTAYGQQYSFTTLGYKSCPGVPTVTDYDGNVYHTIQFGNQCWMRENLRSEHYSDGTYITDGVLNSSVNPFRYTTWGNLETDGYLYNWLAVMNGETESNTIPSGVQGVCPTGWHVPSSSEWALLKYYVYQLPGNNGYSGRSLASQDNWCEIGNDPWYIGYIGYTSPNESRNMSGFGGYPVGYFYDNYIQGNCSYAYFWSCSEYSNDNSQAYGAYLGVYDRDLGSSIYRQKLYGLSVRCVMDGYVLDTSKDGQPCQGTTTVNDNDGHTYNTVQLGSQCWMKENLRTTKYPDGTQITYTSYNTSTSTGYYYYVNNSSSNTSTYGLLYNWPAAMNGSNIAGAQGICPTGWHIPTAGEFKVLQTYVQLQYSCYAKAVASDVNWSSSSNNCAVGNDLTANNATGFAGQPAGCYSPYNGYYYFNQGAYFWSSVIDNYDEMCSGYPIFMYFKYNGSYISVSNLCWDEELYKSAAASIRCIKD